MRSTKIECCFCFDSDRQQVCVLLSSGANQWCEVLSLEDAFNRCAGPQETRHQFREDLRGQAITLIDDGEYRHTSASL